MIAYALNGKDIRILRKTISSVGYRFYFVPFASQLLDSLPYSCSGYPEIGGDPFA
jgi:hypothetical protein